jgi:chemotaxis response regulator CheB
MTIQASPAASAAGRKRVLVVDDSFIMRNLVTEIVESTPISRWSTRPRTAWTP